MKTWLMVSVPVLRSWAGTGSIMAQQDSAMRPDPASTVFLDAGILVYFRMYGAAGTARVDDLPTTGDLP